MMSLNIGEARITRDHNIDRKEIAVRRRRVGAFSSSRRRRERDTFPGAGRVPMVLRQAPPPVFFGIFGNFGIVANLGGKRIPLFPKML
jgi:hypothetical protein